MLANHFHKQSSMATLLGICSMLFVVIHVTSGQIPCKTPDNWDGNCIVLEQCRPLFGLLLKSNRSTEQQDFLKNTQCGYDGTHFFVCCPNTFTIDDLPSGEQCGVQVSDKIYGGKRFSTLTEFPWLALLHYRKPAYNARGRSGYFCGGSLIHENYVLTAAHCVRSPIVVRQRYVIDSVRLGENDLRANPDCQEDECADPVEDIPIAEIIVHEYYDPWSSTQANDIALIRLQRPASYTNYIRPVCLPLGELQNKNHDGLALTIAGFGRTENASRSDIKLKLELNGFNLEQCSNSYRRASINLGSNVLCAGGEDGKDSCDGDAGGPLVAEATSKGYPFSYLVGISSFGPRHCGTSGFPGVYTRVDDYIDWILDHMKK